MFSFANNSCEEHSLRAEGASLKSKEVVVGRCAVYTPLPPLKLQPTGQHNPSRWLEPCLLLQIGSANLLAGIIKKAERTAGRERE